MQELAKTRCSSSCCQRWGGDAIIKEEYDEDSKIFIIKDEDYNEDSFRFPGNLKCDKSSQHQQTTSTFDFYGFTLHLGNPLMCSRAFVILSSKARYKSGTHHCCYFTNAVTQTHVPNGFVRHGFNTWATPKATQDASSFSSEAEFYEGNPPLPFFCPEEGDWCDEDGLYDME